MTELVNLLSQDYSLEVAAKAIHALSGAASRIAPGSDVFIPYLAAEDNDARLAAAVAVRELGLTPVPHFPARRIASYAALEAHLAQVVAQAGVERCFVIAGDLGTARGPFPDSASLIETGVFERAGIKVLGVGGHPGGHSVMSEAACWEVLARKCDDIERRGMAPLIVTQFGFDADVVLTWLGELRQRGIEHPVRVGVPGPASVAMLARYAAMCGVSASASMLSNYGMSIGKLLGTAAPDRFIDRLGKGLAQAHGKVSLHFFPFGGIAQTVEWVEEFRARCHLDGHGIRR